jgi:hypothetical protein
MQYVLQQYSISALLTSAPRQCPISGISATSAMRVLRVVAACCPSCNCSVATPSFAYNESSSTLLAFLIPTTGAAVRVRTPRVTLLWCHVSGARAPSRAPRHPAAPGHMPGALPPAAGQHYQTSGWQLSAAFFYWHQLRLVNVLIVWTT